MSPTSLKRLKKGWGVDISILDTVIKLTPKGQKRVDEFVRKLQNLSDNPEWDTKSRLDQEQIEKLEKFIETLGDGDIENIPGEDRKWIKRYPGGSTGNTVYDLGCVLHKLDIPFSFNLLTVIGKESPDHQDSAQMIWDEYKKAQITATQPDSALQDTMVHGRSYIFVNQQGKKLSLTNSGAAPELINTELINENDIKKADFIFLQSTTMERFSQDFFNEINRLRWEYDKPLVYALPTSVYRGRGEDTELAKLVMCSADYIVCNNEELINIFHKELKSIIIGPAYQPGVNEKEADEKLDKFCKEHRETAELYAQECLKLHLEVGMENTRTADPNHRKISPVALVTRADKGATLIDMSKEPNDRSVHIPTIDTEKKKSTSGAGDAAYAGFLCGLMLDQTPVVSARLGARFAAKKIEGGGPRISDGNIKELARHIQQNLQPSLVRETKVKHSHTRISIE